MDKLLDGVLVRLPACGSECPRCGQRARKSKFVRLFGSEIFVCLSCSEQGELFDLGRLLPDRHPDWRE